MKVTLCVLIFVVISSINGMQLNCLFEWYQYFNSKEIVCKAIYLEILHPNISVTEVVHAKDTKSVKGLNIINQNTVYIPSRFDVLPELSFLRVENSNQQYILKTDFVNIPKIEYIHFLLGDIAEIDEDIFANTPELWYIAITNQKIKVLPKCLFCNLAKLKHVSFHDNKLEVIDGDLFRNNPKIDVVRFNNNCLKIIGQNLFHNLIKLEIVWMQETCCIDMRTEHNSIFAIKNTIKEKCFNETFETTSQSINCSDPNRRLPKPLIVPTSSSPDTPTNKSEKNNVLIILVIFLILLVFVGIAILVISKKVSS